MGVAGAAAAGLQHARAPSSFLWLLTASSLILPGPILAQPDQVVFNAESTFYLLEEQPTGTAAAVLEAYYLVFSPYTLGTDGVFSLDVSQADSQFFSIESAPNGLGSFTLGTLRTAAVLDRDAEGAQTVFTLTVTYSTPDGTLSSQRHINILLVDVNDNAPQFSQAVYSVSLLEEAAPGTTVVQLMATDIDEVLTEQLVDETGEDFGELVYLVDHGSVFYSIEEGGDNFQIDSEGGAITVSPGAIFDVDIQDRYNITVVAMDAPGLNTTTLVQVDILDSNDNPPQILSPGGLNLTLREDTPTGLVILDSINATDEDHGLNAAIYFLILSGDDTNSFSIDPSTGKITLTAPLDHEEGTGEIVTLVVAARDRGLPPLQDTITVIITIEDVNDFSPSFQQSSYEASVREGGRSGFRVLQVIAEDGDEGPGGEVTYGIVEGALGNFYIDPLSGEIFTNATFDREEVSVYQLVVEAVDNPLNASLQLSSVVNVTIVIEDLNDNRPIFNQSLYEIHILDNLTRGADIIVVSADDSDEGVNAAITYQFTDPLPSFSQRFRVGLETGLVEVNQRPRYDLQPVYRYTVRALDGGSLHSDVNLTIFIHDVDETPPTFERDSYNVTLNETVANGTVVLQVLAFDPDPGPIGMVRYRIITDFDAAGSFSVDTESGNISVASRLDFDARNFSFFQVEAYDEGFPEPFTDLTNVTIFLQGENDEPPSIIFPQGYFPTVPEDEPPGYDIVYLSNYTTDPDMGLGGQFNFSLYEIYDPLSEGDNESFSLNTTTGLLRGLRVFDREAQPEGIMLAIETSDFGSPPQSKITNITVMIGDKNDQQPYFPSNLSIFAYEFLPPGVEILDEYRAVDEDIGINAELMYEIVDSNPREHFTVNNQTGGLYSAATLNKTDQKFYNLTIMATDGGSPQFHTFGQVEIEVIDANDQVPIFTMDTYVANVSENVPPGTVFLQVNATDGDIGTNAEILYFLNNVSNESEAVNERFSIDATTGEIATDDVFDRENDTSFILYVIAIDNGSVPMQLTGSATVVVSIEDRNDHTPVLHNATYTADVIENSPNGTLVFSVSASDEDAEIPNSVIRFSLNGSRSDVFQIDPTSGDVTIASEVDWEEGEVISIVVIATDLGDPPLSSTANVTIFISDVNDRAPNFTSLNLGIYENTSPPAPVTPAVIAVDPDSPGNNSHVTYEVVMDLTNGRFELDSESGEVTFVRGSLNRERRPYYELLIRATDHGDPPLHTDSHVIISVLDANDFDPVFDEELFSGSIPENAPLGTTILTLGASDRDVGTNAELSFSIIEGDGASGEGSGLTMDGSILGLYSVNESSGDLITASDSFDFESRTSYTLAVMVTDHGYPPRSHTSQVAVTITDFNDHPPVFVESAYSATMEENLAPYTTLLQVASSDSDSASNKVIKYSLADGEGTEYFGIDPDTGVLHTVRYINREFTPDFQLTVVANNSLSPHPVWSNVTASVTIVDLNDTHPSFDVVTHVYVQEDSLVGSIVFNLSATDGDEGLAGNVRYGIIHGNNDSTFQLESTTGAVILLSELDFEQTSFYEFVVSATDMTTPNLINYTNVLVHVVDVNDNAPYLVSSEYTVTVDYLITVGTVVLDSVAEDADSGTNSDLQYELTEGSELFALQSTTQPSLLVSGSLEHHIGLSVTLVVVVSNPSTTEPVSEGYANVTIHVQEGLPRFTQTSFTASISEDQVSGILIELSLFTVDGNSYGIASGNTEGTFTVDNAGTVSLASGATLDHETQPTHQLTIYTESAAGDRAYCILTISATDVNDNTPQFISSSFLVPIPETTPVGMPFFIAMATDKDGSSPADEIEFNFVAPVPDGVFGTFIIDPITGGVSLARSLDYENGDVNFTFVISASNERASPIRSSEATMSVVVVNGNNHAPVFTSQILEPVVLYENQTTGLSIFHATAEDGDEGSAGEITFGLKGNHRYLDFSIDTFTGEVTLSGELDRERATLYQLEIVAADRGNPGLTSTALLVVGVQDVNDNTPVWEQLEYSISLPENTSLGVTVAVVEATDVDQVDYTEEEDGEIIYYQTNGLVHYSIADGDPRGRFFIHRFSGAVTIAAPLDRELTSHYILTLTATDGGGRAANATLSITVLDTNDMQPIFTQDEYVVAIPENSANGTFLVTVSATDTDLLEGALFAYFIDAGNVDDAFAMNMSTGDIWLDLPVLDREEIGLYNLTVVAIDLGDPPQTGLTQVLVHVLDLNEFPPTFDQDAYSGNISEGASLFTPVLTVNTLDMDFGENATSTFSIVSGNNHTMFGIVPSSGEIFVARLLDFEYVSEYELVVMAVDSGPISTRLSSEVNVTVTVTDVNDNEPTFDNSSYSTEVREDATPGSPVLRLHASDYDSGVNAEIFFSLDPLGDNEYFHTDPLTGLLSLSDEASLDYETQVVYQFIAIATDLGSPQRNSTVPVTIVIVDVNDNHPIFVSSFFNTSVTETSAPGLGIANVTATDLDSGDNAVIVYSIVRQIESESDCATTCTTSDACTSPSLFPPPSVSQFPFTIHPDTGMVSTALPLDRENRSNYLVAIEVRDSGNETRLSSLTCLLVTVLDENDEYPTFPTPEYTASISEFAGEGVSVVQVVASDGDVSSNAELTYQVLTEAGSFTVHPHTGEVFTLGGFNREQKGDYDVIVLVTDGGKPPLNSTTVVKVTILDENDNAPLFNQSVYFVDFAENQPQFSSLLLLQAADEDIRSNAVVTYSIASSLPQNYFWINSSSGQLESTVPLDREEIASYLVTIIGTDMGNPPMSSSTQVNITVLDTNDHAPTFIKDNYHVSVNESVVPESPILYITASDADIGTNLLIQYSLNETSPHVDSFAIHPSSGVLSLLSPLDAEHSLSYTLTVIASNKGATPKLASVTNVTVAVGDINDHAPLFSQPEYVVTVLESAEVGSKVIQLEATDEDATQANSELCYEISGGHNLSLFSIHPHTGAIFLSAPLDREREPSHTLQVTVSDNGMEPGQLETTVNVTFVLQDANDNTPVFQQTSYSFSVHENNDSGILIGRVQANDIDLQSVNYSIGDWYEELGSGGSGSGGLGSGVSGSGIFGSGVSGSGGFGSGVSGFGGYGSGVSGSGGFGSGISGSGGSGLEGLESGGSGLGSGGSGSGGSGSGEILEGSRPGWPGDFFEIDPQNGDIYTTTSFDREERDLYSFYVVATDNGTFLQHSSQVPVSVAILDRNDVTPSFSLPNYTASWPEDTTPGSTLLTVLATDMDLGGGGRVGYSILPSNDSQLFSVDASSGDIIQVGGFDREGQDVYLFEVIAQDYGTPSLTGSVVVMVTVLDVNDNKPILNATQYSAVLREDTPLNSTLISVTADDDDISSNADIMFSLSVDFNTTFTIDERSGVMFLSAHLDYELAHNYTFSVVATDTGSPPLSSSSEVFISVIDLNDNPPIFALDKYSISIPENAILGTPVFQIPATDADSTSNGELRYSILAGNVAAAFEVDETSGLISLSDFIDREITGAYSLSLRAVDLGTPQFTAHTQLLIEVVDVNDHVPNFDSDAYFVSIPELSGIGTAVVTIEATDYDIGVNANLTYSIIAGDPEKKFIIDPQTGEVSVNGGLDFETVPSYSLTVLVSDQGEPEAETNTVILSISILDENEYQPSYPQSSYIIDLPDNTPPGSRVGTFTASDGDLYMLPSLRYSLAESGNATLFSIDQHTGDLYTLSFLPPEEELRVSLTASDGFFTATIDVSVTVFPLPSPLPIYQPPSFVFFVSEDTSMGERVGLLVVTNSDDVMFTLVDGYLVDFPFEVTSEGHINLIGQLDYETTPTYLFSVRATSISNTTLTSHTVVTVVIDDANDSPPTLESSRYILILSELTPVDSLLMTLSAYDLDTPGENSEFQFSITGGNEVGNFDVDPSTGDLRVNGTLDYEEEQVVVLSVSVSNHLVSPPSLQSEGEVRVELRDENDHSPQFSEPYYQAEVAASAALGTPVLTLVAEDSDSGSNAQLTFSLTHLDTPLSFSVNRTTGVISTATGFRGDVESYVIAAAVSDQGASQPRSDTTTIFITVVPDNNFAPLFTEPEGYSVLVAETLPVGGAVVQIFASDPDSANSQITFSITSGNPGDIFTLDPSTGLLSLAMSLDYQVQSHYLLQVMAEDNGTPSTNSTVAVNISLEDINNHAPTFEVSPYTVTVPENTTPGSSVARIVASDVDTYNISYILTVNSYHNHTPLFALDSTTGVLTTTATLDREVTGVHELLVSAVDSGYPVRLSNSVPVIVVLIDLNDTPPQFNQSEYIFPLLRYLAPDVYIATVTATDSDLIGRQLEYDIVEDTSGGLFGVNSTTGVLSTTMRVPEDALSDYQLTVTAFDGDLLTSVAVTLELTSDGHFCEGSGLCTSVQPVNCSFIEFGSCDPRVLGPLYDPFCTTHDYVLSPDQFLCVRHYCSDPALSLCLSSKTCLHPNMACDGVCPEGTTICPTTQYCHVTSLRQSCDGTNVTCLIGQILTETADGARECVALSSLPPSAQSCIEEQPYCLATDECANLTSSDPCQPCPIDHVFCSDTRECVTSLSRCCGEGAFFCGILDVCLSDGDVCELPNIPPAVFTTLIHLEPPLNFELESGDGHVIRALLSNDSNSPAVDLQGEEVSIAVIEIPNIPQSLGEWQYATCSPNLSATLEYCEMEEWMTVGSVSEDSALLLPSSARIWFVRRAIELEGAVWLRVKLWDGNENGYLSSTPDLVRFSQPHYGSTSPFSPTSAFSEDSMLITLLLLPTLPLPSLPSHAPLTLSLITEDTPITGNPGSTIQELVYQVVVPDLPVLPEDTIQGLPDVLPFPVFASLQPVAVREYLERLRGVNPTRLQRQSVMDRGLGPGIGIRLDTLNDEVKGRWQVAWNGDVRQFVFLNSLLSSTNQILLLNMTARIRFIPVPDYCGTVLIPFQPWDGYWNETKTNTTENGFLVTMDTALSQYNLNALRVATQTVGCTPDKPVFLVNQVQMDPIPYYISYDYECLFTVIVSMETGTLRDKRDQFSDLLHVTLEQEVTILRIAAAATSLSSQVSFSLDGGSEVFVDVQSSLREKADALQALGFPITNISQTAYYGPGEGCSSSLTPSPIPGVTVASLTNQIADDRDGEPLGVAVISADSSSGKGVWQYLRGNWSNVYQNVYSNLPDFNTAPHKGPWINFPPGLTEIRALLLHPTDSLRFVPRPSAFWSTLPPSLSVKAWDTSVGVPLLSTSNEAFLSGVNTDPYVDTTQSLFHTIGVFSDETAVVEASRYGCNGVIDSGLTFDPCCVCGGSGETCAGCDGVEGSGKVYGHCDVCGDEGRCEGCDLVPFSNSETGICGECVSVQSVRSDLVELVREGVGATMVDCEGVCLGRSVSDDCEVCIDANSAHQYNSIKDCAGVCAGNATVDDCGYCTGPGTMLTYNWNLDCTGVCGGPFRSDSCDICQLPDEEGDVVEHRDCQGVCYGSAIVDECGDCYGELSSEFVGSALDICGVCGGQNLTCVGCDGTPASGVVVDACGVCGGNDCGCFKIDSIDPQWGPKSGRTEVLIRGAGFFLNDSTLISFEFAPQSENCGAPREIFGSESVSASCQFASGQNNAITADDVTVVNQSMIRCITKATTADLIFDLSVSIETGPRSNSVVFRYYDDALVTINEMNPIDVEIDQTVNISFHGDGFENTGSSVCFLSDIEPCGMEAGVAPLVITANYITESEIVCTLPLATLPCAVKVQLSLDGQQSGVVSPGDMVFTYRYSAPQVELVYFSDDLSDLIIQFDRSAERAGSGPSDPVCSAVFISPTAALLGSGASCYWSTSLQNVLVVHLPPSAQITIDSEISFRAGALTTRGQTYSYPISDLESFPINSGVHSVLPVAIINGPHSIPICGDVTFTGIHSLNPGYRGMSYRWSVLTEDSTTPQYHNIINYLDSLEEGEDSISLSSAWFMSGVEYYLQLVVVNSAGLESTPDIIPLVRREGEMDPQLYVVGRDVREIGESEGVILEGAVFTPDCSSEPHPFSFQWQLYQITDQRRGTQSAVDLLTLPVSSPILYLPPSLLSPSSSYIASLTKSSSSRSETVNVSVRVAAITPRAIIHGGDRVISVSGVLVLDARGSLMDHTSQTTPRFSWSCNVIGSGEPCYNQSKATPTPITIPASELVSIPGSNMRPGLTYNFTVTLSQTPSIKSHSSVAISVTNTTPPIVEVTVGRGEDVTSREVVIRGLVYSKTPVTSVTWESVHIDGQGYVDLSDPTLTLSPPTYPPSSIAIDRPSPVNLVLSPNSLPPQLTHTFQLTVANEAGSSYARMSISPDPSPHSVIVCIAPAEGGVALETVFTIRVCRVLDSEGDSPFLYQFGVSAGVSAGVSGDDVVWLSGAQVEPSVQTWLPSGRNSGYNLTVLARVFDRSGGFADATASVTVQPAAALGNALIRGLLSSVKTEFIASKNWQQLLHDLVSVAMELESTPSLSPSLKRDALSLLLEVFSVHLPATQPHYQLTAHLLSLLTANSNTDLDTAAAIATALTDIGVWFQGQSTIDLASILPVVNSNHNEPLQLLPVEGVSSPASHLPPNTATDLLETWSNIVSPPTVPAEVTRTLADSVDTLGQSLCQGMVYGEAPLLVTSSAVNISVIKTPPTGLFNVSGNLVEFGVSVEDLFYEQACPRKHQTCFETCFVGAQYSFDLFSDNFIRLTTAAEDKITEEIERSNPQAIELVSDILSVTVSIPSQNGFLTVEDLEQELRILLRLQDTVSSGESTPLCLYRDSGSTGAPLWQLDSTSPATLVVIDSVTYFQCHFTHLTEFAVGLLPPPDPLPPSSSATPSPSPIPSSTPSPPHSSILATATPVVEGVSGVPLVIVAVPILLVILLIVTVAVVVVIAFLVWRKKMMKKQKVSPGEGPSGVDATGGKSQARLIRAGPLTPEESKVPMPIIELLESGERTVVGSMNVLPSIRLRELRYHILDHFASFKSKPFYFLTRQLVDIEPPTEQQQFVSLVYGEEADKPIFIRRIATTSDLTRLHFCVCGNAAQFECSICSAQGYCSPECQTMDWGERHVRECSRLGEKKQRMSVLRRQSTSLSPVDEHTRLPPVLPARQSVSAATPVDFRSLLNSQRSFQRPSFSSPLSLEPSVATPSLTSPTKPTLPPLSTPRSGRTTIGMLASQSRPPTITEESEEENEGRKVFTFNPPATTPTFRPRYSQTRLAPLSSTPAHPFLTSPPPTSPPLRLSSPPHSTPITYHTHSSPTAQFFQRTDHKLTPRKLPPVTQDTKKLSIQSLGPVDYGNSLTQPQPHTVRKEPHLESESDSSSESVSEGHSRPTSTALTTRPPSLSIRSKKSATSKKTPASLPSSSSSGSDSDDSSSSDSSHPATPLVTEHN